MTVRIVSFIPFAIRHLKINTLTGGITVLTKDYKIMAIRFISRVLIGD